MPVRNADIASIFNKVADLLETEGENRFRIRAYREAARTVAGHSRSMAEMVEKGEDLTDLPGIGEDLAGKIREIVETGTLAQAEELEKSSTAGLRELLRIEGLGRERVRKLNEELGISSLEELEEAAREEKVREVPGFGEKTEKKILEAIEQNRGAEGRIKLAVAEEIARGLEEYLYRVEGVEDVAVAGSYRRRQETIGDLDVVASSKKGKEVIERFVGFEDVEEVVSKGETRSSVVLRPGLRVDLRVVPEESYGAALLYFTGSQPHHVAIRDMALHEGLKVNEYGVFEDDERVAGKTEEEIYERLGLPYVEPELRENRGEIEAAQKGQLPELITLDDIRGDLHSHTDASDGRNSLREMARAAQERRYEYLAITDHSRRLTVAHGLDEERLRRQMEEIDRLNDELDGLTLLKSIEVDILEDGSLDLSDEVLEELDLVVCSVHHKFGLAEKEQTERILRAMENPHCNVLAHPTGRLINERGPYDLEMERVMEAARENGCFLELNANPDRLDLNDVYCKMAKEMGVKIVISTDAHSTNNFGNMQFGIGQARRGWLEAGDVLNTHSLKDLMNLLKRS